LEGLVATQLGGGGYLVVWEFHVKKGEESSFEQVYGPDGTWAQFFRGGEGYLGTELVRDIKAPGRYLTLDFWTSASAYEHFREQNLAEYRVIDQQCEAMTERELEVGRFEPAAVRHP
jgi:heme-degrading monooxygenase HmoA